MKRCGPRLDAFSGLLTAAVLAAAAEACSHAAPVSGAAVKVAPTAISGLWKAGRYGFIETGVTRIDRLIKELGEPLWHGAPDFGPGEPLNKTAELFEFARAPEDDAKLSALVDRESKIVIAIFLYFRQPVVEADLTARYGPAISRHDYRLGPCPDKKEERTATIPSSPELPFLVYPERGMFFSLKENGQVLEQVFSRACPLR